MDTACVRGEKGVGQSAIASNVVDCDACATECVAERSRLGSLLLVSDSDRGVLKAELVGGDGGLAEGGTGHGDFRVVVEKNRFDSNTVLADGASGTTGSRLGETFARFEQSSTQGWDLTILHSNS